MYGTPILCRTKQFLLVLKIYVQIRKTNQCLKISLGFKALTQRGVNAQQRPRYSCVTNGIDCWTCQSQQRRGCYILPVSFGVFGKHNGCPRDGEGGGGRRTKKTPGEGAENAGRGIQRMPDILFV